MKCCVVNRLDKLNNKKTKIILLIIGIIAFMMMTFNVFGFITDNYFSSVEMLDVKGFYTAEAFIYSIDMYQSSSWVASYLIMHAEDYVFIFTFYTWLILVLYGLIRNKMPRPFLIVIPLLAMACDFFENLIIDVSLLTEPNAFFGGLAGALTMFKFIFIIAAFNLIVLAYILKLKEKNNGNSQV